MPVKASAIHIAGSGFSFQHQASKSSFLFMQVLGGNSGSSVGWDPATSLGHQD